MHNYYYVHAWNTCILCHDTGDHAVNVLLVYVYTEMPHACTRKDISTGFEIETSFYRWRDGVGALFNPFFVEPVLSN